MYKWLWNKRSALCDITRVHIPDNGLFQEVDALRQCSCKNKNKKRKTVWFLTCESCKATPADSKSKTVEFEIFLFLGCTLRIPYFYGARLTGFITAHHTLDRLNMWARTHLSGTPTQPPLWKASKLIKTAIGRHVGSSCNSPIKLVSADDVERRCVLQRRFSKLCARKSEK